jgi:hypothetical protein
MNRPARAPRSCAVRSWQQLLIILRTTRVNAASASFYVVVFRAVGRGVRQRLFVLLPLVRGGTWATSASARRRPPATFGPASAAATLGLLDFGPIAEVGPDPAFDGQRGIETGNMVAAERGRRPSGRSHDASRRPPRRRCRRRHVLGFDRAARRSAPVLDAALAYRLRSVLAPAAVVCNLGGPLEGAGLGPGTCRGRSASARATRRRS